MKKMTMRVLALAPLAASLAAFGCGGLTGELTDLVCECEHCDDWREEEYRAQLDASLEVAEAYECDVEWEEYLQCQIDEGECDEDDADWSVEDSSGSCSSVDTGVPCTTNTDCGGGGQTCNGTTCVAQACAGTAGFPCASDSDCPGESACADAQKDFAECVEDSSDDPSILNVDFD